MLRSSGADFREAFLVVWDVFREAPGNLWVAFGIFLGSLGTTWAGLEMKAAWNGSYIFLATGHLAELQKNRGLVHPKIIRRL